MKDEIYKIVPVSGGFESVWGFDPGRGKLDPIHKWVTDELRPYTKADATIDALKVNTGAIPPND
jgi:hypothetical protein